VCMCRQFILNCHAENHTFEHVPHTGVHAHTLASSRGHTALFSNIFNDKGVSESHPYAYRIVKIVHDMF
jgi:hypothetical protein